MVEKTSLSYRRPVLFGLCELLSTIHSGLLKGGPTADEPNKENGQNGLELEPGGRSIVRRIKKTIHDGANLVPLRPGTTSDYRN